MFRNSYQKSSSSFAQNPYSVTSPSGFMQSNAPLYPIGPTLTRPQFKPIQTRGLSPSPYLDRKTMKPPSYQQRYLKRAQSMAGQVNITFQQRQRRLIQQNQHQIHQQNKRRQQIRLSYERQIDLLSKKLHRNLQSKQKLLTQIQSLQQVYDENHEKLMSSQAPQKKINSYEPIDRKQQQMIILKNKLVSQMRQTQTQLNQQQQEQQKYWQQKIVQKQKYLFNLQQGLRQKRMQLYRQRQKSYQKPDLLALQQQIRTQKYQQFLFKYEQLQKKINRLVDQRQRSLQHSGGTFQLKKPQLHNKYIHKKQLNTKVVQLRLKVQQMTRIYKQMQGANDNLIKQLQRKQSMIDRYQLDIHGLRQRKKDNNQNISYMLNQSKQKQQKILLLQGIQQSITKTQQQVRFYQTKNNQLKSQYQKLYQLLCSAASTNIHQTFNQVLTI